jgi:hypothetical protein
MEGLYQKSSQMERIPWEGQNFSEVVAPKEEEEEEYHVLEAPNYSCKKLWWLLSGLLLQFVFCPLVPSFRF